MRCTKKTATALLLCCGLLFVGCNSKSNKKKEISIAANVSPISIPLGEKISSEDKKQLSEKIAIFYAKKWPLQKANGSVLVAKNGQIIFQKHSGYANYAKKELITAQTPLHIASVTKVITATAIFRLLDAKKISLNQNVQSILKTFPYPNITIKMLLNHRSGLPNYSYFTQKDSVWNQKTDLDNQAILGLLKNKKIPLDFAPNTRFSYCNTNYAILALVLEKTTKLSYAEAINRLVFIPLEMKNSYVFDIKKHKTTATPSYRGNFSEYQWNYLDGVYGDKNIYSTVADLLKLDNGRNSALYLDQNILKKAYLGYSNERKGTRNYGLGMRMINWDTGKSIYYHNGWWHGNTATFVSLPKEKVVIIALSNKYTRSTYQFKKLAALFGEYPFTLEEETATE